MMLAVEVKEPFDDPDWIFEIKWDGYRALASKSKNVELLSRGQKSFNARFPLIVKELEKLPGKFLLDGEIVALDEKGRPQFQLLQNNEGAFCYFVFDLLSYNGKDMRHLPLIERKEKLRELLGQGVYVHFSEHVETFGKRLFKLAKKKGLEGIVAKRKESPYRSRRSRDWLKIKARLSGDFVIGGFTEPKGRKLFGALLIGYYEKGRLIYAGRVGGGFSEKLLKTTYDKMIGLKSKKCPFETAPHLKAAWIEPKLLCEVAFAEWTRGGILRQPVLKKLLD